MAKDNWANWRQEISAARAERRLPDPVGLIRNTVDLQMHADHTADSLYRRVFEGDRGLQWRVNPAYQRGPVWTREQQAAFLGFWQCGGFVPPLVLWDKDLDGYEILDGQQRVAAVVAWVQGEVDAWLPVGRLVRYSPAAVEEWLRASVRG